LGAINIIFEKKKKKEKGGGTQTTTEGFRTQGGVSQKMDISSDIHGNHGREILEVLPSERISRPRKEGGASHAPLSGKRASRKALGRRRLIGIKVEQVSKTKNKAGKG